MRLSRSPLLLIGATLVAASLSGCVNSIPNPEPTVLLSDCTYLANAILALDASLSSQFQRLLTEPAVVSAQLLSTSKSFDIDVAPIGGEEIRELSDHVSKALKSLATVVQKHTESGALDDTAPISEAVTTLQGSFRAAAEECSDVSTGTTETPTP